jgi:hypothetical protein
MATLAGFDTSTASAVVPTPITAGQTLLSVSLPARLTLAGFDMDVSDLDSSAVPTLALHVGDLIDEDRFVASDTTARAGGLLEYRPDPGAWYRYNAPDTLRVRVATSAATSKAGAVGITLYWFPSHDISTVVRLTLQSLGVLAEGETARYEDAALAQEAINEVHERARGLNCAARQDMAWTTAAIPLFAARPYAVMAADLLADTFGLSMQRAQRLSARAAEAVKELRRHTMTPSAGKPVSLELYQDEETTVLDVSVLG